MKKIIFLLIIILFSQTVFAAALNSEFVVINVPQNMIVNRTYDVSVTFKNTGTNTWTTPGGYKIVSQNPENNNTWSVQEATMDPDHYASTGMQNTFIFQITAPSTPGNYNYQWKMKKGSTTFGEVSTNFVVIVHSAHPSNLGLTQLPITENFNGQPIIPYTWKNNLDGATVYGALIKSQNGGNNQPVVILNNPYTQFPQDETYEGYLFQNKNSGHLDNVLPTTHTIYSCPNGLCTCQYNASSLSNSMIIGLGHYNMNWFLENGYSVFSIYQRFYSAEGNKNDYYDTVSGIKALEYIPGIDESRIGLMGASRGGRMSVLPLAMDADPSTETFDPVTIAASIPFFAPIDMIREFENWYGSSGDTLRTILTSANFNSTVYWGNPYNNRAYLGDPNFFERTTDVLASRITTPMFFMGGSDDKVLSEHGSDLQTKLKSLNKSSQKLTYQNGPINYSSTYMAGIHGTSDAIHDLKRDWMRLNFIINKMPPDISTVNFTIKTNPNTLLVGEIDLYGGINDMKDMICSDSKTSSGAGMHEEDVIQLIKDMLHPKMYYTSHDGRLPSGDGATVVTSAINQIFNKNWQPSQLISKLNSGELANSCLTNSSNYNLTGGWTSNEGSFAESIEQYRDILNIKNSNGLRYYGTITGTQLQIFNQNNSLQANCTINSNESITCTRTNGTTYYLTKKLNDLQMDISGDWEGYAQIGTTTYPFKYKIIQSQENTYAMSPYGELYGKIISNKFIFRLERPITGLLSSYYYYVANCTISDSTTLMSCTFNDNVGNTGIIRAYQDSPLNKIAITGDFDGDEKIDKATYDLGEWNILKSNGGTIQTDFGDLAHIPTPGDYDGDGKTDIATYNTINYNYYIQFSSGQEPNWLANHSRRNTSTGTTSYYLGWEGTEPIIGDFDGDGMTDLALYTTTWGGTNNDWHIVYSTGGEEPFDWGAPGFEPIVGDYDGDGKTDIAIYETATYKYSIKFSSGNEPNWLINLNQTATANGTYASRRSTTSGFPRYYLGWSGTTPVTGDFDGDGYTDLAIYKINWSGSPKYYDWAIVYSSGNPENYIDLGTIGDMPIPGDYGNDFADDLATYNPSYDNWQFSYSQQANSGQIPDPPQVNPFCDLYQDRYDLTQWTNSINQWRIGQHSILEIIRRATIWRYCT
jgi:hypothetical protein